MVVQAGTGFSEILRKSSVAGWQHKYFVRFLDRAFYVIAAFVRSDIFRSVVVFLQGIAELFPVARTDADIAVALVVLEQNVVFGRVLLDKAALQNQRLKLAVGDDIFKILDIINHLAHLFGVVVLRAKVLADAIFESLCLAYINNFAALAVHYIHARKKRQSHCLFSELRDPFVHFDSAFFIGSY